MSKLRWQKRHVYQTLFDLLKANLGESGWIGPVDGIPFGETPVKVTDKMPTPGTPIEGNLVVLSFGSQTEPEALQMGPSQMKVVYPFFVDVFASSAGVAMSIGQDIADWFYEPANRFHAVTDYSLSPAAPSDNTIEFSAVKGPDEPGESDGAADFRRYWQIIKGDAVVIY